MADYARDITLADISAKMEAWNNVNDKIQLEKLFSLVIDEFDVMVDSQAAANDLGDYTVTTGLQASLEGTLQNVSNALRVEFLKNFITVFVTECDSVETDGLSYALTTNSVNAREELIDHLNRATYYMSDNSKKINLQQINALLNAEFVLVAAAS
jgi:hypothetical protein